MDTMCLSSLANVFRGFLKRSARKNRKIEGGKDDRRPGDIWSRPGKPMRFRIELLTSSFLICAHELQFNVHIRFPPSATTPRRYPEYLDTCFRGEQKITSHSCPPRIEARCHISRIPRRQQGAWIVTRLWLPSSFRTIILIRNAPNLNP